MGVNRLNSVQKATNLKKKSKVGINEMFSNASVNSKHQHPPRADPRGNFLKWSKTLPPGEIFLQKYGPRDKKIPTPGSIVKDLVSCSCWSASKFRNFAEIKP